MNTNDTSAILKFQVESDIIKSSSSALPGLIRGPGGLPSVRATPISSRSELVKNFGIDTLHLTYDAVIGDRILTRLYEAKKVIQFEDRDEMTFSFGLTDVFSFSLSRVGVKRYPYVLTCGDVQLLISTRKIGSSVPVMALRVGSLTCQDNITAFLQSFYRFASFHGIQIKEEKISRIDLAADINMELCETGLDDSTRYVTRAINHSLHFCNRQFSGMQIGRSEIVMRAYDKPLEMLQKKDETKTAFFQEIWGGDISITRVEFQLRRAYIKEISPKKTDFKTFSQLIGRIWLYLTESWFRQAETSVDRKNRNQGIDKNPVSDFWSIVIGASSCGRSPLHRRKRKKIVNVNQLVKQAAGCMLSVISAMGVIPEKIVQIFQVSENLIRQEIFSQFRDFESFQDKYMGKMRNSYVTF